MNKTISLILLGVGVSTLIFAGPSRTPEIDPASGISALTLIAGAVLLFRGRVHKS